MTSRWLSLSHAAEHLDISIDQLRRFVREGKLPPPDRSLGVRVPRWNVEALDQAMQGTARPPNLSDPDIAIERWRNAQREKRRSA